MFGIFSKKIYKPGVTPEDKDWIERNILWFIEVFGLDKLKREPFIAPTTENFPYSDLKDPRQFQKCFERLCGHLELNPNKIAVKFFDDIKSKQWTTWWPEGEFKEPLGFYKQVYTTEEKRFNIQIAKSNFSNPQLLVYIIAHELVHVKLLGGNFINRNDPDMEPLTDLACIYFGFGVFVANSVQSVDIRWISRSGYLPNQLIGYANALICYITEHDAKNYYSVLNGNTVDLFRNDYEFLCRTNNTLLTKHKVSETESFFKIGRQINDGFEKRNFEEVIEGCKSLLEANPEDYVALNNMGYALLLQKRYQEAIVQFTRAIDMEPYWEYPYNNRGYCKLQLGDFENAYYDLQSSFEMNRSNSYSWRNLGAYYLLTNDYEKALHHFEEAEKIDPKTELINFYLSKAHAKIGNREESRQYLAKSVELDEYNDSTIEELLLQS